MREVVILSGVRTAIGRFQGGFANTPASDLGAAVIRAAVERAGIAPSDVDQVILGCVGQVAEDAYIARHAAVKAGLGVTVLPKDMVPAGLTVVERRSILPDLHDTEIALLAARGLGAPARRLHDHIVRSLEDVGRM